MKKNYFMLKVIPPRAIFKDEDVTPEEQPLMEKHAAYWKKIVEEGKAIAFGAVMAPTGIYGLGILAAENESEVASMVKNDPANASNRYEYFPMMVNTKE
jgi:uncharacterized protein